MTGAQASRLQTPLGASVSEPGAVATGAFIPRMRKSTERSIITDKLVVAQTGATMEEWFRHLDSLGAQKMAHVDICNLVASIEGLKPLGHWNQNLLATSYEWDRGLKERGQKGKDFEISVSKTVNVSVEVLFKALFDEKLRKKWLDENIEITKQTENKSVRAVWSASATRLSVDFYPKSDTKSQIVVQHLKLPDSTVAAAMKELWATRLDALKSLLQN